MILREFPVQRGNSSQDGNALHHEGILERARIAVGDGASAHAETVAFLSRPDSYPHAPASVEIIESHMSLVFLAGNLVFKLKRPIQLKFADFRALEDRKTYCERELALNQQIAPGVYLRTLPVTREAGGELALGGKGRPVDWLVEMRRLDCELALDAQIERNQVAPGDLAPLCAVLAGFYQDQPAIAVEPEQMLSWWQSGVDRIEQALTDPQFDLPSDLVDPPLAALRRFLATHGDLIAKRVEEGRIIDGHGDLKPEHVYLGPPVLLMDRLEFDDQLRWCDPFDEIAFLGLECTKLGAAWIAPALNACIADALGDRPPKILLDFYRCYRACMRARLSIEHLHDEAPRTPERWPKRARAYLRLANDAWANDAGANDIESGGGASLRGG